MSPLSPKAPLAFALALALLLATATVVGVIGSQIMVPPDIEALRAQFVPLWRDAPRPEPVERLIFLVCTALAIPAVVFAVAIVRRWPVPTSAATGFAIGLSVLLACLALPSDFAARIVYGQAGADIRADGVFLMMLGGTTLVAIAALWRPQASPWLMTAGRRPGLDAALVALALLSVLAVRLRTAGGLAGDLHFEAVYYAITQVMAGRTLLADLPAQYGLYAELLAPIFALTGSSVAVVSAVFVGLQAVAMLAVVAVVFRLVRTPLVRGLAILSLSLVLGSTWLALQLDPFGREYYQIWPLRFLFPALSLWLFLRVRDRGFAPAGMAALGVLAGVGLIWNLDSGIPVYGALIASILFRLVRREHRNRARVGLGLALVTMVPLLIVAALMAWLWIKSGGTLNLLDWVKYQLIFYATGFNMLPLPLTPHPWMAVLGLYLLGIVLACMPGRSGRFADFAGFVSVLGIGLFVYYQGRSHDIVLSFVVWPALVLMFGLADRVLRAVRAGILVPAWRWSTLPAVALGLLFAGTLIVGTPRLLTLTGQSVSAFSMASDEPIGETVAFVREATGDEEAAVILSRAQAVLFGESGLRSALGGPGLVETLLVEDLDRQLSDIAEGEIAHVFVARERDGSIREDYMSALTLYEIAAEQGGLVHFVPQAVP